MKKTNTIRSMVAMMVIVFAVATTSCKKEENMAPATPTAPVVPVTPTVSVKPRSIITTEDGTTIRKQLYVYDNQSKLIKYISANSTGTDSVLLFDNNVTFKKAGASVINGSLTFNADKTFGNFFTSSTTQFFESNGTQLLSLFQVRNGQTPQQIAEFRYLQNNLTTLGAEIRIDINYHDNLPYQKGINEIPVLMKAIQFYKVMEQENITTTVLHTKLIRQVIMNFGGGRLELHEYAYTFDTANRIIEIKDTVTFTTTTSSSQKIRISTITYNQN